MTPEEQLQARSEPPTWFRAPSSVAEDEENCKICWHRIRADEIIGEVEDEFGIQMAHEACYESYEPEEAF